MAENQNKRTFISLISSLISMVLSMAISFFLSPYIVANLGAEANGFAQLASNFVNYATLITIALNSMAARFMTMSYHKGEIDNCKKYFSSVFIGNIAIIAVLILPALYMVIRLESIINIETADVKHVKILFGFVFANFFISQIGSIFSTVFYVKNAQYIPNVMSMFRTLLNAGGLLLLFSVFPPRIYYVSLMGLLLSFLSIPVYIIYKRKLLPTVKFQLKFFDFKVIWKLVSSGIWNTITQCGNILMTGLDLLLSNLFISPIQMGVLAIAKTAPNIIISLGVTVNGSFSPNLTIAYAEGNQSRILSSLRYAMKCSSILMGIPIIVLYVYGSSFYSLWVPTMNAVELSVLAFLSSMAFIPCSGTQVLFNVFTTTNRLKLNSVTVLIGGVLNFAVVYLLLKFTNLGVYAVAGVSSVITMARSMLFLTPYSAKLLGMKWYTFYKDVLVSCVVAGITFAICFITKRIIIPSGWVTLVISIALACLISFIILIMLLLDKGQKIQFYNKIFKGRTKWIR